MKSIKTIFRAFKEMHQLEKRLLPTILGIAVISALSPFVSIFFTSKIIDLFDEKANAHAIVICVSSAIIANLIIFFLNNYLNDIRGMYRSLMYTRELYNISSTLYKIEYQKIENSEFKELVHKHSEAQERLISPFSQLNWLLREFLSGLITILISAVILFPLLKIGFKQTGNSYFEKPEFLITIIVAIVIIAVVILLIALKMSRDWFKTSDEYSKLDRLFYYFLNFFSDYNTGKEIRIYKEQNLIRHIASEKLLSDGEYILRKASYNSAKSSSIVAILGAALGFAIYVFIGVKGLYGLVGIGSLVLYSGSFMQIINGVMKMSVTFGQTEEIIPLVDYYFEIVNMENDMSYGDKTFDFSKEFEIEFKNVSFKYPNSNCYALKNVNLKIENGTKLAIVGRNGSGKTTLIKLICRFYDVTEGQILINGVNIKDYTQDSIIKLYSVVFQDFKIFSLPLYQNISANDRINAEKLSECLEQVNIRERVENLPNKEKTYLYKDLDKNGVEISGGEAQKLALARALYKNAPIVILDEPTAALDPVAENEIYSRFNSFTENKTAIYISHRLSSCIFCDRIAVFDNAKLVEEGTHEQLLNSGKKYSELWNAQAQYYLSDV